MPFFLHGGGQWHTFASDTLPHQTPFCYTTSVLSSVTWQQNWMQYCWKGKTSPAIPPVLASGILGQDNKIGDVIFKAALEKFKLEWISNLTSSRDGNLKIRWGYFRVCQDEVWKSVRVKILQPLWTNCFSVWPPSLQIIILCVCLGFPLLQAVSVCYEFLENLDFVFCVMRICLLRRAISSLLAGYSSCYTIQLTS